MAERRNETPASQVTIDSFSPDRMEAAIGVLARAYATNPLHVAAFGPSRLEANEAFFRLALEVMKGGKLLANEGGRIVGVAHWVRSPGCQISALAKLGMMPSMLRGLGFGPSLKVVSWLSKWAEHDPRQPHCHLGPIAVEPDVQGRHIGSRLMETYCQELDQSGLAGYLETDRPGNVAFYKRFGFVVTETAAVLGVENYFMRRA